VVEHRGVNVHRLTVGVNDILGPDTPMSTLPYIKMFIAQSQINILTHGNVDIGISDPR